MRFKKTLLFLFIAIFTTGIMGQARSPKTPREFFLLLSQDFFYLENLRADNSPYTSADLRRSQNEYLKRFLEIEDNKNGFMQGGGDGSQENFKLALFKRANGTYVAGLFVGGEWGEKYYFLEYKNGKLRDISSSAVPRYKRSNVYEFPQYGTTIKVFERRNFSAEYNLGETGRKLYALIWKDGKFKVQNVQRRKI